MSSYSILGSIYPTENPFGNSNTRYVFSIQQSILGLLYPYLDTRSGYIQQKGYFLCNFCPTQLVSHTISSHVPITVTVPAAPKPSLRLLLASVCMSCPALQAGQVDVDGRGRRRGEQTPPSLPHSPACLLGTRRRRRRAAEPVEGDRVS